MAVPRERPGGALLAVGGHLDNTVATWRDGEAVVFPHVGDLDSPAARAASPRLPTWPP